MFMLAKDPQVASGCKFLWEFSQRIAVALLAFERGCSTPVSGARATVVGVATLDGKGSRTNAACTISGITCVGNNVRKAQGSHCHERRLSAINESHPVDSQDVGERGTFTDRRTTSGAKAQRANGDFPLSLFTIGATTRNYSAV